MHTLILYKWKPIFRWLPIETIIRECQEEYYNALGRAYRKFVKDYPDYEVDVKLCIYSKREMVDA